MYDLAVIGGGWAGLTAATIGAEAGLSVCLIERNRSLGGRTSSFWDARFNCWLDNGPHLFLGAYTTALDMLEAWGSQSAVDFSGGRRIAWIHKKGRKDYIQLGGSSSSLSNLLSLLKFRGFSWKDRFKTTVALRALVKYPIPPQGGLDSIDSDFVEGISHSELTAREWLSSRGIKPGAGKGFWEALMVSVMNGRPSEVAIEPFAAAMQEGLRDEGRKALLGLPRLPFQHLIAEPAAAWLINHNVKLNLRTKVRKLLWEGRRIQALETSKGEVAARNYILAVPPADMIRILPLELRKDNFFSFAGMLKHSSIAGFYIDFDRPVLADNIAGTPGRFVQWIFGRGLPDRHGWRRISAVVSASPKKSEMSSKEMSAQLIDDIRLLLPSARNAFILNQRLVRNSRATVLLSPGSSSFRLPAVTPVENLFLAGDWIQSRLPATMESAARSGKEAAMQVVNRAGS